MPNLNVAVIGPEGYAKDLGKKGTTSDITFYNQKKNDVTVTLIEPTRYPEKLSSLFYAVSLADAVVLVVEEINPAFGECVLLLDCAKKERGLIVLRNFITPEQIAPLIRETVVAGYAIAPDDTRLLRERLVEEASSLRPATLSSGLESAGAVPVDHFFAVRGIGTVVLGVVARGTVKRHDTLRVYPTTRQAQVRSMQKHDDDAESAYQGERVGLALKGVETDDLDRGYVLSNDPSLLSSSTINGRAQLIRYWPHPLKEGMVLYIGHWMQFLPARVAFADNAGNWKQPLLTLRMEKNLVYPVGATGILHYLEGGKLRIVGTIALS